MPDEYIGGAASWRPCNVAYPHQGEAVRGEGGAHIQGNKVALVALRPRILLRDLSVSSVVNQENKKETFIRVRTGVGL